MGRHALGALAMNISLDTSWDHNEGNNVTSIATPSAAPTAAQEWITGWLAGPTTPSVITSIVDSSTSLAIPANQIIYFGATGGFFNAGVFFFYTFATTIAARTFTASFTGGVHCTITAQSWKGLTISSPVDQVGPVQHTGSSTTVATGATPATRFGANGLVLTYFVQDAGATNVWSAPLITVGANTPTFNGLGNATLQASNPAFDAGYAIPTVNGAAAGQITTSVSGAWLGAIVTLSDQATSQALGVSVGPI